MQHESSKEESVPIDSAQRLYQWVRRNSPALSRRFWAFCIANKSYFPKWIKNLGKQIIWSEASGSGPQEPSKPPAHFIHPENLMNSLDTHLLNYFVGFGIETDCDPIVTIVIPVHNNISITIQLLNRLRINQESVSFEIIIVDDASTDQTKQALRKIRGIKIITLNKNKGYLLSTNIGIEQAKGKYICLLNNDTLPESGWLTALYDVISNDPTVAVCGSMLIDSNGQVLEAGSQIFNNKTIWNLGRDNSRSNPMYQFNREVDYCSAASILVDGTFLRETKGFDTRYTPAYFEDTDLCMQAWNLGKRVIYVHNSVVHHIEGASHGKDVKSGIKSYQVINAAKFWSKWGGVFNSPWKHDEQQRLEHSRNSKGIVVYFDDGISDPAQSSGSHRAFNIIQAIMKSGFHVAVIPITPLVTHELLTRYRSLGVEIYPTYESALRNLLYRENRLKAVWLSRVTVADKVWGLIKSDFKNLPIIFDTVDLHFLREQRAKESNTATEVVYSDDSLKSREIDYMKKSQAFVVVSAAEKLLLEKLGENLNPHLLFDTFDRKEDKEPLEGKNSMLFVGNFSHHPNSVGLKWFIEEIHPLLPSDLLDSIHIDVIGMGAPAELVQLMEMCGIKYHGWQENLDSFYRRARVSIAPLTFGAGIKGKIIESYFHGVPVITTEVGIEGTGLRHMREIVCANDPISFAEAISKIFSDDRFWSEISTNGNKVTEERFGHIGFQQKVEEILRESLGTD
jgi:O-antigen biosynthesis protein